MNVAQAKSVCINDYLERLGHRPKRRVASGTWYISMLVPTGESTPSFQVSIDGHAFHDWSTGFCGNIVDLAMLIINNSSVAAALQHIGATVGYRGAVCADSFSFYKQNRAVEIISVNELRSACLFSYAKSRMIPRDILTTYCSEVRYRQTASGKEYYSIGWPNDSGGWELRNAYFKGAAAPKDITVVHDLCGCPMLVFEGFFDFLSAVQLGWYDSFKMNAVVLNSTALIEKAIPVLHTASQVLCFLDNDHAGRVATARILQDCPSAEDRAYMYGAYNDVSDYMNDSKINKSKNGSD